MRKSINARFAGAEIRLIPKTAEIQNNLWYKIDEDIFLILTLQRQLEALFRHKVFRMLQNKGEITEEMIRMLSAWKHSGFHVFCGNRISPTDATAMENLARYIIRASFSQERMQYLDQEGKVIYTAKDKKTSKVFPALEWLAAMCLHIPNRGEQMVRY